MAADVRLLAGREYSVLELTNKLSRRFNSQVVESVVEELAGLKVLDDERYGEAFCRSRVERGYGPGYIARELVQNGLDTDLIDILLEPYQDQWFERAQAKPKPIDRNVGFGHESDLLAGVETPVMRFRRRHPSPIATRIVAISGKSGKRLRDVWLGYWPEEASRVVWPPKS